MKSINQTFEVRCAQVNLFSEHICGACTFPTIYLISVSTSDFKTGLDDFKDFPFRSLPGLEEVTFTGVTSPYLCDTIYRYLAQVRNFEKNGSLLSHSACHTIPIDSSLKLFDHDIEFHIIVENRAVLNEIVTNPTIYYQSRYIDCAHMLRSRLLDQLMGSQNHFIINDVSIDLDAIV